MSEKILGNEALLTRLQKTADLGRVANAYILAGPQGSGKRMIADAFQEMLGVSRADRIDVTHEKPGLISVDDIRNGINRTTSVLPNESTYKLYVVDEAEKMNIQAQNALLKTLEEPPKYVVILLLTENEETFLPTILSRAVRMKMSYIPENEIIKMMQERGFSAEESRMAAHLSDGVPGKAIEIAESEDFKALLEEVIGLVTKAGGPDPAEVLAFSKRMAERKTDANEVIRLFRQWYRDVLAAKAGAESALLFFSAQEKEIRKNADHLSFEGIGRILDALELLGERLRANVNTELSFESFAGAIREEYEKEK